MLLLSPALPATAAPAPPGATACSGCHGPRADAAIPSLAGRTEDAILASLLAYRRGEGAPTVMDRITRGFSEAELRAIAAWVARP